MLHDNLYYSLRGVTLIIESVGWICGEAWPNPIIVLHRRHDRRRFRVSTYGWG